MDGNRVKISNMYFTVSCSHRFTSILFQRIPPLLVANVACTIYYRMKKIKKLSFGVCDCLMKLLSVYIYPCNFISVYVYVYPYMYPCIIRCVARVFIFKSKVVYCPFFPIVFEYLIFEQADGGSCEYNNLLGELKHFSNCLIPPYVYQKIYGKHTNTKLLIQTREAPQEQSERVSNEGKAITSSSDCGKKDKSNMS